MTTKISKNFTLEEFECSCCGRARMDPGFIGRLQRARDGYGKPMSVNSGWRCSRKNALIGGAPKSQHLKGKAADIAVGIEGRHKFVAAAIAAGMRGIGIGDTFVHVDSRSGPPRIWTY